MSETLQELKIAVTHLAIPERAELAQFIIRLLDEGEEVEAHEEWLALAQQRMADVKAGRVVGIPAEEVLRTLLEPGQ